MVMVMPEMVLENAHGFRLSAGRCNVNIPSLLLRNAAKVHTNNQTVPKSENLLNLLLP